MFHPIKHFKTITKHRHKVMLYCFKCGLYTQGLLHDLSKYGLTEFMNGAKNYAGTYSPHHNERKKKGYSEAWLHHKGRNKHHLEYWIDVDVEKHIYLPVNVPNRYIAESICDRIAASKVYRGKDFKPQDVLDYFYHEGNAIPMTEETRRKMVELLTYYKENGEKKLFKYIKENYRGK